MHWFRAPGATAAQPMPTVLMGPGWGQAGGSVGQSITTIGSTGGSMLTWPRSSLLKPTANG